MPLGKQSANFILHRKGAAVVLCLLGMATLLSGCDKFSHRGQSEKVYVLPREKFLKDRVAVLASTTATVTNGEPLEVLEHSKRFLHVRTPKGETGWIEEATVASQQTADAFNALAEENKSNAYVATATASAEARMHLHPGRSTTWLYLLEKDDKVKLLKRAIAPKAPVQASPVARPASESGEGKTADAPEIPMEDWWLARDAQGRTGWVLARSLDVDVPDALLKLGQGERFMGVYPLDSVHDENSGLGGGPEVSEFAVAYAANHSGLMYDFDQVVVYTWNARKHRYEGAYRDRNIEGFLPLVVTHEMPPNANEKRAATPEPVFRYKVAAEGASITLPDVDDDAEAASDEGVPHPSALIEKGYRLEGVRVIPVGPVSKAGAEAHPETEKKNSKKKK